MMSPAMAPSILPSPEEPPQELHARLDVGEAVVPGLALDGEIAAVLDGYQHLGEVEPVDVAVPERHFLRGAARAAAGVAGVGVDHLRAEGAGGGVGVVAVDQQVRRVEVRRQTSRVEAVEETA